MAKIDWSDPEQVREYNTKYRQKNKKELNRLKREKYAANPLIHQAENDRYYADSPEKLLITSARGRSKRRGLECSIDISDVVIPDKCPVFGTPLIRAPGMATGNSPSLDRIDSTKGYIKGNVWVISLRANFLKSDATTYELERVISIVERIQQMGGIWYPSKPFIRNKIGSGQSQVAGILKSARRTAKTSERQISIEHSDIVIPNVCPILGIPLFKVGVKQTDNSPSIDRIDPSKGYVKGNVWIISWRANRIKKDGTVEEFKAIVKAWHAKLEELTNSSA